jgi:hypothetical protein
MTTLGTKAGYEHLWKESEAKSKTNNAQITFIDAKRFYNITTSTDTNTTLLMARSGQMIQISTYVTSQLGLCVPKGKINYLPPLLSLTVSLMAN